MDRRVSHLRETLIGDLTRPWTVREMAKTVNLSVSHLNRLFLAELGSSPIRFLNRLRVEHAAELLRTSFLSVKQIRCHVGFRDKAVFIAAFKKQYGVAPTEYRKISDGKLSHSASRQ